MRIASGAEVRAHAAKYEFKVVLLLALGFGLVGLDRWLVMPLAPQIMRDLKLDYQDLGNLGSAVGLSWGVFAILMGGLADRVGRRRIIIPAIVLFSLLSGAGGLAGGLGMLLFARALMGVAEGAYCPASFAAAIDVSPEHRRGLNLGVIQGCFSLFGLALGPIIATQLVRVVPSWRDVFLIVATPGLIVSLFMYKVLRDPPANLPSAGVHHGAMSSQWKDVLVHRNLHVAVPAMVCAMVGVFVVGSMTPVFLTDVIGFDGPTMGIVMSGLGFGGFVGQITLGGASDIVGRRPALMLAFVVGAAALVCIVTVARSPVLLFILLFAAAFCCCGAAALLAGAVAGEAVPPSLSSTAVGIVVGLGEILGGGVAPSAAGRIAVTAGLPAAMLTVAGVLASGALISFFLLETAPRLKRRSNQFEVDFAR